MGEIGVRSQWRTPSLVEKPSPGSILNDIERAFEKDKKHVTTEDGEEGVSMGSWRSTPSFVAIDMPSGSRDPSKKSSPAT